MTHLVCPQPPQFLWLTGIEDTFISARHRVTGRVLDEYLLTGHYDRWKDDLRLIRDLGVDAVRYGIPWYRVCLRRGKYDWSWCDKVFDTMVSDLGLEPVVDLIHYGTPEWMQKSFLDPDYPSFAAEYALAFAEHFKGACLWYTPLNEPRVNAWYSGRLGWWPPYERSWQMFARILSQIARGICLTQQAIRSVQPESIFLHVDASDLYTVQEKGDERAEAVADLRQDIVFLALDLVCGRIGEGHSLRAWLHEMNLRDEDLEWFRRNRVKPDVIGFNMYPMFSLKEIRKTKAGGYAAKIRKCWVETLKEIGRLYHARYPDIPLMVTETAGIGSMNRRIRWIKESTAAVLEERAAGIPYVGYTFWPFYSLVSWAYQSGKKPIDHYMLHMGLYDLVKRDSGYERVHTEAVEAFKKAITEEKSLS